MNSSSYLHNKPDEDLSHFELWHVRSLFVLETNSVLLPLCIVYGDPNQALFFGGMGIVSALVFGNMGAAYGTAKSGVGICSVAVLKPELIIKSIIPVVMAGILGIYGLIISVIISGSCK